MFGQPQPIPVIPDDEAFDQLSMDNNEHPNFVGSKIEDECDACRRDTPESKAVDKWMLPCEHFVCRNCLPRLWLSAEILDIQLCCPVMMCSAPMNFPVLPSVCLVRVNRDVIAAAEELTKDPTTLDTLITFERHEAKYLLEGVYEAVADHLMGLTAAKNSLFRAPVDGIEAYFDTCPESDIVTPRQLNKQLVSILIETVFRYSDTSPLDMDSLMAQPDVMESFDEGDMKTFFDIAHNGNEEFKGMFEVWTEIVSRLVSLLVWRDQQRFPVADEDVAME